MKIIGIIFSALLGLAALIGLGIALDLGGLIYQEKTAGIRGQSEAERTIESGHSRIQLYNEFFALCADIQAKEAAIDAISANSQMPAETRELAITGNQIARQSLISKYNGNASRSYTAARFRDANLPYRIPLESYRAGQARTACAG